MATVSTRAAKDLRRLLTDGVLTSGDTEVRLSNIGLGPRVLGEVRRRYGIDATGASEEDARHFARVVLEATEAPDVDSAPDHDEAPPEKTYWRLHQLTAHNYRGLTEWEGKDFTHDFRGVPCHIYGTNGSGKTSILSAIVWCLTGACIRERSQPDDEVCGVTLYVDESCAECIGSPWPEIVTVPHGLASDDLAAQSPQCRVEAELAAGDRRVTVRRELPEGSGASVLTVIEGASSGGCLEEIGITEFDLETTLLMPARVSALQFEAGSKFSDNLLAVSGLGPLTKMGELARKLGTTVTKLANKQARAAQEAAQQARSAAAEATSDEEVREAIGETLRAAAEACAHKPDEPDAACWARLYEAQAKAVEDLATEQFAEIESAVGGAGAEGERASERRPIDRKKTADALISAKAKIEQLAIREWAPLTDWLALPADTDAMKLVNEWAWSVQQRLGERYPTWLENKAARGRLDLRIRAGKYMAEKGDYNECPVCERELPEEIRQQLHELATRDASDTESLRLLVAELRRELSEVLGAAAPGVRPAAPAEQLAEMLTKHVLTPMEGLGQLREQAHQSFGELAADLPEWASDEAFEPLTKSAWDMEFTAELAALEQEFQGALRTCRLAIWARQHAAQIVESIQSMNETTTRRLSELERYARQYADLMKVAAALERAAKQCSDAANELTDAQAAARVSEVLKSVAGLGEYAEAALDSELGSVAAQMREFYGLLYPKDAIEFSGLVNSTAKKGAKPDFRCTLKWSDNLFVDADPVSNAGRMRGILWAYTFALIEAHDPALRTIALHDPYLSLDDYAAANMMSDLIVHQFGGNYQPIATTCDRQHTQPILAADPDQTRFATLRVLRRGPDHRFCRIEPGLDDLRKALSDYACDADKWEAVVKATRPHLEDNLKLIAGYVLPGDYSGADLTLLVQVLGAVAKGGGSPTPLGAQVRGALRTLLDSLDVELNATPPAVPNSSHLFHALHHGGPGQSEAQPCHADVVSDRYPRWSRAFSGVFDAVDFVLGRTGRSALLRADCASAVGDGLPPLRPIAFSRPIESIGRVAAEGRWSVSDTDTGMTSEHAWPELEFALVATDVCAPVALLGQTAVFAPDAGVKDGDLAMIGSGGEWYLRRVFRTKLGDGGEDGWIGQTVNLLAREVAPVVRSCKNVQLRKLIGVLYTRADQSNLQSVSPRCEIAPIPSAWPAELGMLHGGRMSLIAVSGDSAEPVALDGQFLIVAPTNLEGVRDGSLCCIRLSDGTQVLKRLTRARDGRLLLQPINAQAGYPVIEATSRPSSGGGEDGLPWIEEVLLVKGVLFAAPEQIT